jgi:hypothetical protein
MRAEVLRGKTPAPSRVRTGSPAELDGPVLAALERDPARRPATAEEMLEPLRAWLASRGGPDPARLGRLLADRLPPEVETEPPLDRTARLADPAAAARQVTLATSAVLSAGTPSLPPPRMTERDTRVPATPRRTRMLFVAIPAFLAALLAAVLLAPGTDPTHSTGPAPTPSSVPTAMPASAAPATALVATAAPDAGVPAVPAPRPGRVKVLALPWGEITVNDRAYGRAFPAAGVEVPPPSVRIRITGPHGEVAAGSGFIRAGKETVCSTDFSAPVRYVRCVPPP